jgi:hypothetical protein
MGIRAVKVRPEVRVVKLELGAPEALTAPLGRVALRAVLTKALGVALAPGARMPELRLPELRVLVGRVKRGVPTRGRLEALLQARRLTRMGSPLCGPKVAHVELVLRAAQAALVRVPRLVARALQRAGVGPANRWLAVHRQVPATATQTAQASRVQPRAVMTGNPKVRQRTSRVWASPNPREAIARSVLSAHLAVVEWARREC